MGRSVNKNDRISKVAYTSGLSKTDASNAVDAVVGSIIGAMKSGDDVRLVGLELSVLPTERPAKVKPSHRRKISIPASRQPKFKAGKGLKAL